MIELPGWRMGSLSSERPQRGPEAMRRKSLAILISTSATLRSEALMSAKQSVLLVASIMLAAVR